MKPTAYEGKEKYIFISYAHKDSDQVLAILERMEQSGYRIWYDDGIAPGSEWPENIAQHLDGCAVCIAFVSANSIASANCRREVTFALSRQKPFLGILLEPTQMSLGMELQLSAQQCILRHNFRREEDFIQKILSCPDLEPCRNRPEPAPAPIPEPAPIRETVPAPEPEPKSTPQPKPPKREKPPRPKKEARPRKPLPKWLLPAAGVMVLALVLFLTLSRVRITPDLVVDRKESSLSLRNVEITPETVEKLNKLGELKYLYLYNCTQQGDSLSGLNAPNLHTFHAENTPLSSLSFLVLRSPQLQSLTARGCGLDNESSDFPNLPALRTLDLGDNPDITTLDGLDVSRLTELNMENTAIDNLSILTSAASLGTLDCSGTGVSSIDGLASLTELAELDFSGCPIETVTEPFLSLSVHTLYFDDCGLTDAGGFSNMTVLREVSLRGNQLTDISWLVKSTATLQKVNLSFNPLDTEDIAFLSDAREIRSLKLDTIPMEDLSLAADLSGLETLSARCCGIRDISHLSGLSNLTTLRLAGNRISDLSGLPGEIGTHYGAVLDLAWNEIANADSIPRGKYQVLTLHGNPLVCSENTFADLTGSYLTVDYHELLHSSVNTNGFYHACVTDVPADQQLALADVLGYTAKFVTPEELLAELSEDAGISYDGLPVNQPAPSA